MSDQLLEFKIPAPFIQRMARLTPRELRYGYVHGWIDAEAVVQLCMGNIVPDDEQMAVVEALALLLSDELDKVPDLIEQVVTDDRSVWVYLALAFIHEHPSEFGDNPLQAVEMLYADFEYPSEMEPFVPFMPPPEGATPGAEGLEQRWQEYLHRQREKFLGRADRSY